MLTRVVIVEDEEELREEIVFQLQHMGFSVRGAADGVALDRLLAEEAADVVLLDIGLPGEDGYTIAARLRGTPPTVGVIMLTARGRVDDRVQGLDSGADAYLVKPVDIRELVATIHSVARRLPQVAPAVSASGGWSLDALHWQLVAPNGSAVELSANELKFLLAVAARQGDAVERRDIVSALGENYNLYDNRRMDSLVRRLRNKVEVCCTMPLPLRSVHAVGYAVTAPFTLTNTG